MVPGLHDPLVVVVERRQHRRPAGRTEAHQAALRQRPLLHVVVGTGAVLVLLQPPGGAGVLVAEGGKLSRRAGHAGRRHLRVLAVRRIRDDRGPPLAVDPDHVVARVHVEGVVAAAAAGCDLEARIEDRRPADRRRLAIRIAGLEVRLVDLGLAAGDRRCFLVRQGQPVAELARSREGSQRRHVVGAGEIRLAVGPARNLVLRGNGDRGGQEHRQAQEKGTIKLHPAPPRAQVSGWSSNATTPGRKPERRKPGAPAPSPASGAKRWLEPPNPPLRCLLRHRLSRSCRAGSSP